MNVNKSLINKKGASFPFSYSHLFFLWQHKALDPKDVDMQLTRLTLPRPLSLFLPPPFSSLHFPEPWRGIPIVADGSAMVHAFPLQNTKQWGEERESCVKEKKMTCGKGRHGWIDRRRRSGRGGVSERGRERERCKGAEQLDKCFEKRLKCTKHPSAWTHFHSEEHCLHLLQKQEEPSPSKGDQREATERTQTHTCSLNLETPIGSFTDKAGLRATRRKAQPWTGVTQNHLFGVEWIYLI